MIGHSDFLNEKGKTYSILYHILAVVHVVYLIIFAFEKCKPLMVVNALLVALYIVISIIVRNASRFSKYIAACSTAMAIFLLSHYILLGPSFGFQYLVIGMIPLMFFLAYVNGAGVEISRRGSIATYIALSIVSFACARIQYPLVDVSETTRRIVTVINLTLTFFLSIQFMTEFVRKTYEDAGALEHKNLDLEKSASIDTLTGLLNRRTIETYINRAIFKSRSEGNDFSLLMCDIDNFKRVNDTYGHDCGDQVLKNIASIIKSEVRPDDAVFRWGGEEILIVVNAGAYVAKSVAERCRAAIEKSSVEYNGNEIKVTITIGGSTNYQGATRDDLVNRADKNLYEGKQNGKNQVVM